MLKEIVEGEKGPVELPNAELAGGTTINVEKADSIFAQILDQRSAKQEVEGRTPENHGEWEGERGNSKWYPQADYIPPEKSRNPESSPFSNPEQRTWDKILESYGIDGIPFENGYPDFGKVSKGNVEIDEFQTGGTEAKEKNFKRADIAMAEERGCMPNEVKEWRKENNYTWHECEDKRTMQKVPNEIHANIPHDGGRSRS